jgi:hypothetical protein
MTLIHFKDRLGVYFFVNPANILYVTTHANEPGTTFIYLVGGGELATRTEVAEVVSALSSAN